MQYWMYAVSGGPNEKWGEPISNGGPGTTAPRWLRPWAELT